MTPARFRWGILLILIGVLLLLRNGGILNDNFWGDLMIWFPVVLIAIGIEKIFANSRLKVISYMTSVALFFGGLLIAFAGSYGGNQSSFFSESTYKFNDDSSVNEIRVFLDLDGTDLTIRDSGDDLVYGRFDRFTRKPKIKEVVEGGVAQVKFISRSGSFLGGAVRIDTGEPQDWFLSFSKNVPLDLECVGKSSDMHLNMSTTPLKNLKLKANDAKIYLKIGDMEPLVKVTINGEDSKLRLRLPETVGVRIHGNDYRSYLQRLGFHEEDGAFITDKFDSVMSKIDINLDANLASFSLDFF